MRAHLDIDDDDELRELMAIVASHVDYTQETCDALTPEIIEALQGFTWMAAAGWLHRVHDFQISTHAFAHIYWSHVSEQTLEDEGIEEDEFDMSMGALKYAWPSFRQAMFRLCGFPDSYTVAPPKRSPPLLLEIK